MKHNRLFGILYLLLSNKTMTASDLASYFEVSVRTIYRDIESLSELHIPIYMSKGKNGGIHLLDHYKLDKALLSDEEQDQILFSLEGINRLQVDKNHVYEKMKSIFSKDDENWFEVDFSVWDQSDIHKENFEIIKNAIIHKNVIEFLYFNSYGTSRVRKVEPLKLYFKYNSWYLCGFDIDKNDTRFFKTDQKLPYRVSDEFDESCVKKLEDGNFIVTVEFPFSDWIYGYILSFGEFVKVLEPEAVQKEIIDRLKKSLNNYS